jgi:hypothetical protein
MWSLLVIFVWVVVGSESGQKHSVTPAEYGLQHNSTVNTPPPQSHTVCFYLTLTLGRGEVREKVAGQQYTRGVENTNMTVHGGNSSRWVENTNHE